MNMQTNEIFTSIIITKFAIKYDLIGIHKAVTNQSREIVQYE